MTTLRTLCLGITLIGLPAGLVAGPSVSENLVIFPQMAEKEYMLQMVRETGSKDNQYEQYTRQCNVNGICRFSRTDSPREIQYKTPYGMQTVIYPHSVPAFD